MIHAGMGVLYNTNSNGVLIVKAVAKDGIMVDINTFENSQKKKKNSEGACWVNFEMTMTEKEREREREKGSKEGVRERESGRY